MTQRRYSLQTVNNQDKMLYLIAAQGERSKAAQGPPIYSTDCESVPGREELGVEGSLTPEFSSEQQHLQPQSE